MEYIKESELLELEKDYKLLTEFAGKNIDKGLRGESVACKYRIYSHPTGNSKLFVIGQFKRGWIYNPSSRPVIQYFLRKLGLWNI